MCCSGNDPGRCARCGDCGTAVVHHPPWSEDSFVSESLYNQLAFYYVLEYQARVIAYGGLWTIAGEGHITNIAVHPDFRGNHLGRILVENMLKGWRIHGMREVHAGGTSRKYPCRPAV